MHWSSFSATPPAHLIAAAAPLLLLAAGLLPFGPLRGPGPSAALGLARLTTGTCVLAASATGLHIFQGAPADGALQLAAIRLPVQTDALSLGMLLLVSLLLAVIARFSRHALAGDPKQAAFSRGLARTGGAVMTMAVSGSLLVFALGWVATSLFLHGLLLFHPERRAARSAAWRKFVVSRLADLCMAGALWLTWRTFGTWDFASLFAQAETLRAGEVPSGVVWTAALLGCAALLKSAQVPFHGWLPDTLETPTPVSALMHAGIINAGGFLVVRLSPLFAASPRVLDALALAGAATALFGSVVMLTQTSIKRALAYSTVAQMGFMMLECGLGAFSLAVLHILAHSLYKAHAFLSSGSIVRISRSAWVPSGRPAAHPRVLLAALATALSWILAGIWWSGWTLRTHAGEILLALVLGMAVTHLLWTLWSSSHRRALAPWGVAASAATVCGYFLLHAASGHILSGCVPTYAPDRHPFEYAVMGLIVALFSAVLVFQEQLPAWDSRGAFRSIYARACRGFGGGIPEHLHARLTQNL